MLETKRNIKALTFEMNPAAKDQKQHSSFLLNVISAPAHRIIVSQPASSQAYGGASKPLNADSSKIFIFILQAKTHQGVAGHPPPAPVLWQSRQLFEIRHQIVLLKPLAGAMLIAP